MCQIRWGDSSICAVGPPYNVRSGISYLRYHHCMWNLTHSWCSDQSQVLFCCIGQRSQMGYNRCGASRGRRVQSVWGPTWILYPHPKTEAIPTPLYPNWHFDLVFFFLCGHDIFPCSVVFLILWSDAGCGVRYRWERQVAYAHENCGDLAIWCSTFLWEMSCYQQSLEQSCLLWIYWMSPKKTPQHEDPNSTLQKVAH